MALEVINREYAKGAEGYAAMVADVNNLMEWSKVDDTTSDTSTTFKMLNSADGKQYAGITIFSGTNYPTGNIISSNGATDYVASWGSSSNLYARYANIVKWDGGFNIHTTYAKEMPSSETLYNNFGVCRGTKIDGNAKKWCSWLVMNGSTFIGSDDTSGTTATPHSTLAGCKFTTAHPLCSQQTAYVPDSVLFLRMIQEYDINTCGYCTWNGKRYYKNGAILIPAE